MRLTHLFVAVSLLALACGAPGVPEENVPSTDEGTSSLVSMTASGDVSVSSGGNASGEWQNTAMRVDSEYDGSRREVFLKFSVNQIPAGTRSVKLAISNTEGGYLGTLYKTGNFSESTLTWQSRPAKGAVVANPGWVTTGQRVKIDVTSVVRAPGTYSFVFSSENGDGVFITSRESSDADNRPVLEFDAVETPPPGGGTPPACTGSSIECQAFVAINQQRAMNGKPALKWNSKLAAAALAHNNYMTQNNCFSHQCTGERSFSTRISDAGYSWRSVGETIAAGYPTAAAVVSGWMNSPGHKAILLGNTQEVGISQKPCTSGCTYSPYWTADFGTPR